MFSSPLVLSLSQVVSSIVTYTICSALQETTKAGKTYLGKIFVLFEGFEGKHTTGYIDGEGAITSKVTVYGPMGENDIKQYNGFKLRLIRK